MRRLRLDLAYLGTRYAGWQIQRRAEGVEEPPTIQGVLRSALERLHRTRVLVHGASRTDAGVHAEGQCAHVDVPDEAPAIPPDGLRRGLNAILPEDVRVMGCSVPPAGWHARFSALGKRYRYRFRRGDALPPYLGLVETLAPRTLDLEAMQSAARLLSGRRDFSAFGLTISGTRSGIRTLVRLEVLEVGPVVEIVALGDGFLRGMVRRLAGTLLDVGRGRTPAGSALVSPGPTAPARGLTLERVFYRCEAGRLK